MLLFQSSGDTWSPQRIEAFVTWWTGLNYLRMVIGGLGWLCLLRALSLSALTTRTLTNSAVPQPDSPADIRQWAERSLTHGAPDFEF
jgi:hypothetical protein